MSKKIHGNSKYCQEKQDIADQYIEDWMAGGDNTGDAMPSNTRLSLMLGVTRQTMDAWAKKHAEFAEVMWRVKALQKLTLQNGGLLEKFNPSVTKLVLATNHGMSDRQAIDHTSGDEPIGAIRVEVVGAQSNA